ncbi:glutathione S-transferase [Lactarius quietus]|nr:glutathione S-transferase [Lactarius quietus]
MSISFKLFGSPMSTCTRRVALIAKERNIPYTLVPIDFTKAEHKAPSHVEHQPFGQVPYAVFNDGFELYESRAISRYIITLGSGPQLIPTEPRQLAVFEQAASVEYSQFDPIVSGIAAEKVFKPRYGKATNEAAVTELLERLEIKLNAYEVILGKQKYLAGNEVTFADISHLPYGSIVFENLGLGGLDKRPNLQRWWNDISSRPSWQAVKGGA